jgi:hypothetical protein
MELQELDAAILQKPQALDCWSSLQLSGGGSLPPNPSAAASLSSSPSSLDSTRNMM